MSMAVLERELETRGHDDLPASSSARFGSRSTAFWLVVIAFAVRLAFLFVLRTYQYDRFHPVDDFCIAGETTNIAASIASGHGFSSAFNGERTGPTAWIAPVYPYLVAVVFHFLGSWTQASFVFMFVVQSLISGLTVVPILGIASRTVGRIAGFWAASIWCLFPWFSKWSVTWLWDTSLSALLLSVLFWYALRLPEARNRRSWLGFGALWGFSLLVNPALATLLPVSLAWCGYELHRRRKEWLKPALTSLLVCAIVISPWLLRNRAVFGHWVFLRGNFGFEFALGNYHASLGRGWGGSHPSGNQKEFRKYEQMGEYAYVEERQEQALRFVRDYPREFAGLTAKRLLYFWDGSAMGYMTAIPWYWAPSSFILASLLLLPALLVGHRRNLHAWPLFFGELLLYPAPYYLAFSQVRYRHAIEPLMLLLIAYAGVEAAKKFSAIFRRSGGGSGAPLRPQEN